MKRSKTTSFKAIATAAILVTAIFSAFVLSSCKKKDSGNVLEGISTYASYDTSYITKLADYKNITVTNDLSVTDEDVRNTYLETLESIMARCDFTADEPVIDPIFSHLVECTGGRKVTEKGDIICFDYAGKLDGEPLEGGTAQYTTSILGAGYFIPGFEESIIGHETGTDFDIFVTFPESYPQNTDLQNREVCFNIYVHYILPAITDDSVAVLLEYEKTTFDETKTDESKTFVPQYSTAAEYVEHIKEQMRTEAKLNFNSNLEGHIMYALYSGSEFSNVPQAEIDNFKKSVEETAAGYGVSTEVYLYYAYGGIATQEEYDELARFQVCTRGIVAAVVQSEKMTVTRDELDTRAASLAQEYGYDSAEALISAVGIENVCNAILAEKAVNLLIANTTVDEKR